MTALKRKLVIVGVSEIASVAYEYFKYDSEYEPATFAVDEAFITSELFEGLPVCALSRVTELYPPEEFSAFVAAGSGALNRNRMALFERMAMLGYELASYISSRAFVWRNVTIGKNCFVLENNVLQPFTALGDNVTLWSGNHIGHRSIIQDHVFISSHAVISGFCTIGTRSFIGVNAATANGVDVAPDNFIAMSASIATSTVENGVYRGNPAELQKVSAKRLCRVRE